MGINALEKMALFAVKQTRQIGGRNITKTFLTDAMRSELRLSPASQAIGDTWHFTQVDGSLNPEFLKGLLKIEENTPLETFKKIKDEILKAMGFNHPEKVKLEPSCNKQMFFYIFERGTISLNPNTVTDNAQKIALMRHELEHMLQSVKVYKAKGKEEFIETVFKMAKKQGYAGSLEDFKKITNIEFYETMAKNVSISSFDTEKYFKGMSEYTLLDSTLANQYKYYNNPLEKDAYNVQKRVLRALGENDIIEPDIFPKNYKIMLELIENKGLPLEKSEEILNETIAVAQLKLLNESPENIKNFAKIMRKILSNAELLPEEIAEVKSIANKLSTDSLTKQGQKPYQLAEKWMREGKYTVEDILKDM